MSHVVVTMSLILMIAYVIVLIHCAVAAFLSFMAYPIQIQHGLHLLCEI